jgi:hypothetical protein
MNNGRQAAKHLIARYVERGDTLSSLRGSYMGESHPDGMNASIGGAISGRVYGQDYIVVRRDMEGREVNIAFKLFEIYAELKSGQTALF